jgi:tetratricopeptide (TPR) repeat protein
MTEVRAGNFAGARALLNDARSLSGDDADLHALIALSDAYVEAELSGTSAGQAICRPLLDVPGLRAQTYGRIWAQLGLLEMRAGDANRAIRSFSHAVARLEGEPEHLGRALLNRGTLHLQRADPARAVADFSEAYRELTAAGLSVQAAKAQHNLGYAQLLVGELLEALARMEEAAQTLAPLSPVSRATCEQDKAEVLLATAAPRKRPSRSQRPPRPTARRA